MSDSGFRSIPVAALVLVSLTAPVGAADSSFTFQGHLSLEGAPVTGVYDFRFSLYDAPSTGSQIGAAVSADDVAVKEGLFQTPLDFGASAFDGAPRWLEIAVRDGTSTGSYRPLSPRTPVSRTPYAVHALKADEATTAAWALQAGLAAHALHADHATSAVSAAVAHHVPAVPFAANAAALGGQPATAFAASSHSHTGATIDDGTIDAADLTSNPASLAKVTDGAAVATADGRIGLGTTSPTQTLDVRGSVSVEGTMILGNPELGSLNYDPGTSSLILGKTASGIDQENTLGNEWYPVSSAWQTFLAGVSGYLHRIDVLRGGAPSPKAAEVFLYETTSLNESILLTSGTLPSPSSRDWQPLEFSPPVRISAGTTYTIELKAIGEGDIAWWIAAVPYDAYPRGRSSYGADLDYAFRTYVEVPSAIRIAQDGNVTIGFSLTVRGEAYKPGGGAWASLSDSRAKTGIATIAGALDKILQLRGVTFRWKDPAAVGARDSSPVMGLIADEVEKVFPQWVSRGPDGLRRLKMVGFEGLAVEALKEISSRHNEEQRSLEEALQALEVKSGRLEELHQNVRTRLADLEARLDRLESQKIR